MSYTSYSHDVKLVYSERKKKLDIIPKKVGHFLKKKLDIIPKKVGLKKY